MEKSGKVPYTDEKKREKWYADNAEKIKAQHRKYYQDNKERLDAQNLATLHNRRNAWIESQGGKCVKCGSTENLEVDHIDPSTKNKELTSHRGGGKSVFSLTLSEMKRELEKCQVLCSNCHKWKTALQRDSFVHGRIGMYTNHGCRCDECKEVAKQYRIMRKNRLALAAQEGRRMEGVVSSGVGHTYSSECKILAP